MAIAFDSSVLGAQDSGTFAHTCTGSNRILFVYAISPGTAVTGITYNGVAMTQHVASQNNFIYYLIGPSTGANNIVIAGPASGFRATSASYNGVSQTGFPDSTNYVHTLSSSVTVNTTVVDSDCWLINFSGCVSASTPGISSNRTDRQTGVVVTGFSPRAILIGDSNSTVSTGSQGTIFTATGGGTPYVWGSCVLSIKPPVSGPTNLKSYNTNVKANIKSINTNLIANIKSLNTNS